ncbi:MAG TPA: DUF4412 domain-containing protein [Methylomirabilota bacterium]|nr:DUF4412 domain-containing protein [Methylomirabilota bacterium]
MKRSSCVALLFFVAVILAAPGILAQMPEPFSADYTHTTPQKDMIAGKIFFSAPKMRIEMNRGGREMAIIFDQSTRTTLMLMPQQRMYMEFHADQTNPMAGQVPRPPMALDANHPCPTGATCGKQGTETVNGRVCDKWVSKDGDGTTTLWIDQKLHFPVKSQNPGGETWELRNVKEGRPDSSVFEVPPGYQKLDPGNLGQRPR